MRQRPINANNDAWIWVDATGEGAFDKPLYPTTTNSLPQDHHHRQNLALWQYFGKLRRGHCFHALWMAVMTIFLVSALNRNSAGLRTLEDATHEGILAKHKHVFVHYYNLPKQHNQDLKLLWEHLRQAVSKNDKLQVVKMVSLECRVYKRRCHQAQIHSFPTLRWYQNGEAIEPDYDMDFSLASLMKYVKRRIELEAEFPEVLTTESFDSFIRGHPQVFCLFYKPSDKNFKAIRPVWNTLATQALIRSDLLLRVTQVDCTVHSQVCHQQKQNISTFPTMRYFANGNPTDYHGPYELDALVTFAKASFRVTPPHLYREGHDLDE